MRTEVIGKKFGMLAILELLPNRMCRCLCDCGLETIKNRSNVTAGRTACCGCARGALISKAITKHGEGGPIDTPEYKAWMGMIHRCYAKSNNPKYKRWGGRGISVCQYALETLRMNPATPGRYFSPLASAAFGQRRPSPHHSLDRYPNNNQLVWDRLRYGWSIEDALGCEAETKAERRKRVSLFSIARWGAERKARLHAA